MEKPNLPALGALAALLAAFAVFLALFFVPVLGGVDANGYHVAARIFQEEGRLSRVPPDGDAFVGVQWVRNAAGRYYPKYPPIYPVLVGTVMKVFGTPAGLMVNPALAWLTVAGMYALGRAFLTPWLALLAAFTLAVNPVFATHALRQLSHPAGLFFLIWGWAAFLHGRRIANRPAGLLLSAAAGLLIGCAAGTRYADALGALPLFAWCLSEGGRAGRRRAACLAAGLAVPAIFLAAYHRQAFGNPFLTGYALTGEQAGFAAKYFFRYFPAYTKAAGTGGVGPLTALLAVAGFVFAWVGRPSDRLALALWIAPPWLLYSSYYFLKYSLAESLRFLLPVFIPVVLLAALALEAAMSRIGRRPAAAAMAAAFVLLQGWWGAGRAAPGAEAICRRNAYRRGMVEMVERTVPAGAVVIADKATAHELDYLRRYRLYQDSIVAGGGLKWAGRDREADEPAVLQAGRAVPAARGLPGGAEEIRRRLRVAVEEPLSRGTPVFLAGPKRRLAEFSGGLPAVLETREVAASGLVTEPCPPFPSHRPAPAALARAFPPAAVLRVSGLAWRLP